MLYEKKFSDWKFTHESFNTLEISNEFQERYLPTSINVKKEEIKPKASIKIEKNVILTPKKSRPPPPIKTETQSDDESLNSQRSRVVSSEDTNQNILPQEINNNQEDKQLKKSPSKKSRRRKSKNWNKKNDVLHLIHQKKMIIYKK